tara:strand:- start:2447 stop:3145 length:699 start_codon:yes stop_codon:yes gene_type:complete
MGQSRRIKSKGEIKDILFKEVNESNKKLLEKIIDLDPITLGENKIDLLGTRKKWQQDVIEFVTLNDMWLEFGVREGQTINWLLEKMPLQVIHGFDSWEGLPEEWNTGAQVWKKGEMNVPMPKFTENVILHKGWFQDTIDPWKAEYKNNIAYLHIDSDLYSSAKTVLTKLNDRIVPGTLIVFDELINFRLMQKMNTWTQHEWKALTEWRSEYNREVTPVARSSMNQVALRVIS